MSHVPEDVDVFVCTSCQIVHAGTVSEAEDGHAFSPPAKCGACGNTEFVGSERWAYHAGENE